MGVLPAAGLMAERSVSCSLSHVLCRSVCRTCISLSLLLSVSVSLFLSSVKLRPPHRCQRSLSLSAVVFSLLVPPLHPAVTFFLIALRIAMSRECDSLVACKHTSASPFSPHLPSMQIDRETDERVAIKTVSREKYRDVSWHRKVGY